MRNIQYLCGAQVWREKHLSKCCVKLSATKIEKVTPVQENHEHSSTDIVFDLSNEILFPGFIDAHAHPLIAGFESFGPQIREADSVADALKIISEYEKAQPELPWILGEGFDLSISGDGNYSRYDLDKVVKDKPVVLRSSDIHTFWVNSKALEIANINKNTPDPIDGVIERDQEGNPTGTLREWGAFMPVYKTIPRELRGSLKSALLRGLNSMRDVGVTSVQDAWVELEDFPYYLEAARDGLPLRLNVMFRVDPHAWKNQLALFVEAREQASRLGNKFFSAQTVKFFADGIIEGGTASVINPYSNSGSCCGLPAWPAEELSAAVQEFDKHGFQVHIHAIGDQAVKNAVSAIESAAEANGSRDRRPVIAHAQLIAEEELAKIVKLDITVAIQPYWAKLDGVITKLTNPRLLDERQQKQYPFKTALNSGIRLALSSDFPITTPDPLKIIAVALSRDETGDKSKAWLINELLNPVEALEASFSGSSYVQFSEKYLGSIEPGYIADLVSVQGLGQEMRPENFLNARVTNSWLSGKHKTHNHKINEENI